MNEMIISWLPEVRELLEKAVIVRPRRRKTRVELTIKPLHPADTKLLEALKQIYIASGYRAYIKKNKLTVIIDFDTTERAETYTNAIRALEALSWTWITATLSATSAYASSSQTSP